MSRSTWLPLLSRGSGGSVGAALCLAAGVCLLAAPASAQVFGQFSPVGAGPGGPRSLGAYGHFSDGVWGALGVARQGFGQRLDGGFSLGFASHDDTPTVEGPNTLLLGLDGRYQVRWASPGQPVDAALGVGIGLETGDQFTRWLIAPQLLASHRLVYDSAGRAATPYASAALAWESVDIAGFDDSDVDLIMRVGGLWEPSARLGVSMELGFGGETTLIAGVRWPF